MRIFVGKTKDNEEFNFICHTENTKYGFSHICEIGKKGRDTFDKVIVKYINRTWESYNYETVLSKALEKLFKNTELGICETIEMKKQFAEQ